MAVKVMIGSIHQRVDDEETEEFESLEIAVDAMQKRIEGEIRGADFGDDGEEEEARWKFIKRLTDPKSFADFETRKKKTFRFGVTDYNPVRVVFELVE
jgi:hypothetical protein